MSLDWSMPLPLVTHSAPDNIVAWHQSKPITLQQFMCDVNQLASQLLPGRHLLNVCSDRYHFSVGLAAAIITNKISLLPSTYTPEIATQLKTFAPDVFCLTDSDSCNMNMPLMHYPDLAFQSQSIKVPDIPADQLIAIVFTSGSTGEPQPHHKTWGSLVQCVQMEAKRVGLLDHTAPTTLVGTVPPQHMYGFESTVLMPWQSGHAFSSAHPFYPADICQALTDIPKPRLLVSTPVHLRALLDSELTIPEITSVVSATAPLSIDLATEVELRCSAPIVEIYGCTETGQIATRRSTQTNEWHLFDGIKLSTRDESIYAIGGHVAVATKLNDKIEPVSDSHFILHGRLTDMINIAGKRHSLTSLNHLLNNVTGVIDGVYYMPEESGHSHITRLAAFVVKNADTNATQILAQLRSQVDPVFLPRPLVFVDKLPRNSTGKLPQTALKDLYQKNHKAEE
jgi:acyl-coenzyme A synthetase/AMP-(fatty) acid ligase